MTITSLFPVIPKLRASLCCIPADPGRYPGDKDCILLEFGRGSYRDPNRVETRVHLDIDSAIELRKKLDQAIRTFQAPYET